MTQHLAAKLPLMVVLLAAILLRAGAVQAQAPAQPQPQADRLKALQQRLDSLSRSIPGLNRNSDLMLSDVPLHDYVRSLGKVHQDPEPLITYNYTSAAIQLYGVS